MKASLANTNHLAPSVFMSKEDDDQILIHPQQTEQTLNMGWQSLDTIGLLNDEEFETMRVKKCPGC